MLENINYNIEEIKETAYGKKYKVSIELPMSLGWIEHMRFCIEDGYNTYKLEHQKNEDGKVYFSSEVELKTKAIYRYYFSYFVNGQHRYHKKNNITSSDNIIKDEMWKLSVNFNTPEWAKGRTMYHIFIDRFKKGHIEPLPKISRRTIHESWEEDIILGPNEEGIWNADFYGGDLKGIEESLDYLSGLGVDIIYLSPVCMSQSNHRYDTSDYEVVDPYAGTNEDLKKLCDEAHKRNMHIIIDAVFNHTGNDSKYFNEYNTFDNIGAFQSLDSKYANFYRKHYENGKIKYDYWWGMTNLPVCDGYSKEWQAYIVGLGGIIDQWFNLGIDGLRLDVADELTDEFIEMIREAVKRNKEDGFILGEVWKNPMRMGRGYIESGKGMDSVMNYSFIDALIRYFKYADVDKLKYIINDIKNEYPESTIHTLMNFTSTHDISRAINIFATDDFQKYGEWAWNPNNSDLEYCKKFNLTQEQYEKSKAIYEAYIFALSFMPGILSIFYGDEVGIQGLGNLNNRKTFPWNNMDQDLLEYFKYIGSIRKQEEFLRTADLNILDITHQYLLFERVKQDDKMLIAVNRTSDEIDLKIPSEYEHNNGIYTLKKSTQKVLTPYGGISIKK